jgi:hypothetical protein
VRITLEYLCPRATASPFLNLKDEDTPDIPGGVQKFAIFLEISGKPFRTGNATRKFNGVRLGGVEGRATRL